jgi:hypothetical protein
VHNYDSGDLVYILNKSSKKGRSKKLTPIWKGPFLILEVLSPSIFRVRGPRRVSVVHHDLLKPFQEQTIPGWVRRARHHLLSPLGLLSQAEPPEYFTEPTSNNALEDLHIYSRNRSPLGSRERADRSGFPPDSEIERDEKSF